MPAVHADADAASRSSPAPALLVWAGVFALLFLLDPHIDLASGALLLVLGSALAALWVRPAVALAGSAGAVLGFNVAFVPPRGTWQVDLHQHVLLLLTVLGVSWIVTLLMGRLRRMAAEARASASRSDQLRHIGAALRDADAPASVAPLLQAALQQALGPGSVALVVVADEGVAVGGEAVAGQGDPATLPKGLNMLDADERAGVALCRHEARAMGPGTGWHEEQPAWYLPMRGPTAVQGVVLLRLPLSDAPRPAWLREHAQSLCDLMGAALDRAATLQAARAAEEAVQAQRLRNTLLASIAHDHRTPLATILGAASMLHDQAERLDLAQRLRLAATIVDEATQLDRLTANTLQLARLDAPGLTLRRDWESVEELVGTALRRVRQRRPGAALRWRRDGELPLLRVDAVLLVQLLDNLVDNALRHGGESGPVELLAWVAGERVVIAVRDRGPGVPPSQRACIFEVYVRGDAVSPGADPARPGAGVGLALCRAIARVHGGELGVRERHRGGASFELWLPIEVQPT
ncbi:ATP-binding protein [Leptothrix discophora]|uniref:histidine kinase n=1 Tax=Leptothrix discophora TaxID=89 RepID=A0ABT9G3W1_LEPDI|nr:ATP-binding protein [Leptothrix discophora]